MKKVFYASVYLVSICAALIIGVVLQINKVPSRFLHGIKASAGFSEKVGQDYKKAVKEDILKALGRPAEIYGENEQYIYSTGEERTTADSSYRYYWHYEEIARYLVSEETKTTAIETHEGFWNIGGYESEFDKDEMVKKREYFKKTIGVKNLPENGVVKERQIICRNNDVEMERVLLESRIRGVSVPLYSAIPSKMLKGVVIAIHGHSGAPEKVMGLEPRDYTREFGKRLTEAGYAVFAPYVMNISRFNTNIHALGMIYSGNTKYSIDLQKLLSVVDYIKNNPKMVCLPLAVWGVSYGGRLSFMLGAIEDRIDIVISSGGMKLNKAFLEEHYSLGSTIYWASEVIFNQPFHIYFKFSDMVKFIFPKPLIIELGAYDLGEHSEAIIGELEEIMKFYRSRGGEENFKLSWFKGYHETAPEMTIQLLDSLIKKGEE